MIGTAGTCFYCGFEGKTNKDHFWPKSKGGMLTVHSCYSCNDAKRNLIPEVWICQLPKSWSEEKIDKVRERVQYLLDSVANLPYDLHFTDKPERGTPREGWDAYNHWRKSIKRVEIPNPTAGIISHRGKIEIPIKIIGKIALPRLDKKGRPVAVHHH